MTARDNLDINQVVAIMIVIIALGILIDALFFRTVEKRLQRKWGFQSA